MLVLQASSTPGFKISTIYYVPANNENVEPDEREGEITTEDTVTISQRRNDVRERITQNTNRRDEQEKEALPAPSQVMSDIPGHLRSVRKSSFPTWSCLVSQLSAQLPGACSCLIGISYFLNSGLETSGSISWISPASLVLSI